MKRNVAIVGAGIAGLMAANELLTKGHKVTLYEKSKDLGGQLGTVLVGKTKVEKFYHHAFSTDSTLLTFCKKHKLYNKIHWLESKQGFYTNKIYDFGTPTSLLFFKPLSFVNRIKYGLGILLMMTIKKIEKTKKYTAKEWISKKIGKKVWKIGWEPLFKLKFDHLYDKIAFTWLWDKIRIRGKSRGKNKEKLAYMKGSFQHITDTLVKQIKQQKGIIKKSTTIEKIRRRKNTILITSQGKTKSYDNIIFATPSEVVAKLIPQEKKIVKQVSKYKYVGALVALYFMKKGFSSKYWITIGNPRIPFGGIIEHSNFFNDKNYQKKHIVYVSRYISTANSFYKASEKEILEAFNKGLQQIKPSFNPQDINKVQLFKVPYAQPVVDKGYKAPPIQLASNIHWVSTHHTYPHDRGINYALALGKKVAKIIETESK